MAEGPSDLRGVAKYQQAPSLNMSSSFHTKASVSQPRYAALRALLAESKRRGKPKANHAQEEDHELVQAC